MAATFSGLRGRTFRLDLDRRDRELLLLVALGLWGVTFALLNLGLFSPAMEFPVERALRRVVTCGAGVAICLAMVPLLQHAMQRPLAQRLLIALAISAAAWALHLGVRLAVFHLYDPLWGPLSLDVVGEALKGGGWMFPVWASLCLLILTEARTRVAVATSAEPPAIWAQQGSRRVRVAVDDLLMVAAERDYVRLHTRRHHYLVRGTLKEFAATLPAGSFMQVHRSAIVRLDAIEAMERAGSVWRLRLGGDLDTLISRTKSRDVRAALAAQPARQGVSGLSF
ncbi:LytTR family DNA-binding domain-containing protein [Sphingoaurantiacus capsulatus]|uniref:LytTR family DNA-binding domain-containing protein n=1 Tax=Sphingoaurantiacus capsulatus TaxID=1771310 RepID=A0ABV7X4I3_9SPHN